MVLVLLNQVGKAAVADQVTSAILEKIGPDAPPSLVEAAKAAGKCFSEKATTGDLVKFGLSKI